MIPDTIRTMKISTTIFLISFLSLTLSSSFAEGLTSSQIESIQAKIKSMRENLEGHLSNRNSSAGQKFLAAASDPRAALALYLECHKVVNFEREGRPDADYRAWEDEQQDRVKNQQFAEGLQMQLRYLALSCQAAESEKIEAVFAPLLAYVDALSRLDELPSNEITGSVANSIFSERYYLQKLLGGNPNWEPTPFNIGGIYEKTIFPHLRTESPEALMNAWDKRIEQQNRIVAMIQTKKEEALRGLDRDEERKARTRQDRQGGVMSALDQDDYVARTLPKLKWGKLKDQFLYVDEVMGAKAMLDYVDAHLTHELGEDFFSEFSEMMNAKAGESSGALPGEFESN